MNSSQIPSHISSLMNDTTPAARSGHSMNVMDGFLFTFFGKSNTAQLSDVWKCCLADGSFHWSKIPKNKSKEWPLDRASHTSIVNHVTKNIVLFGGGQIKPRNLLFNDAYLFNPFTNSFSIINVSNNKQIPLGRFGHSSCIFNQKLQVFFGQGERVYFNDIYTLNLLNNHWKKEEFNGIIPAARYKHAYFHFKEQYQITGGMNDKMIFNDIFRFNLLSNTWLRIETKGNLRCRFSHQMYVDRSSNIAIFGGSSNMTSDSLELCNVYEYIQGKTIAAHTYDKFHCMNTCFSAIDSDQSSFQLFGGLNDNYERINNIQCVRIQDYQHPFIENLNNCIYELNDFRFLNCDQELFSNDNKSILIHSQIVKKCLNIDQMIKKYESKLENNVIKIYTTINYISLRILLQYCQLKKIQIKHLYQDKKNTSYKDYIQSLLFILEIYYSKDKIIIDESSILLNSIIEQLITQKEFYLNILNLIQTSFTSLKMNLLNLSHFIQTQIIQNNIHEQEELIKQLSDIPTLDILYFNSNDEKKFLIFDSIKYNYYDNSNQLIEFYQTLEEENSSKDILFQQAQDIKARSNKKESIKLHSIIVSIYKNYLNQAVESKCEKYLKKITVMSEMEWKDAEVMVKRMQRLRNLDGLKHSDQFGLDWG